MENNEPKPDVNQALLRIAEIKTIIGPMGANSNEFPRLEELKIQLQKGEITPEYAIAEADKLLETKQDYH